MRLGQLGPNGGAGGLCQASGLAAKGVAARSPEALALLPEALARPPGALQFVRQGRSSSPPGALRLALTNVVACAPWLAPRRRGSPPRWSGGGRGRGVRRVDTASHACRKHSYRGGCLSRLAPPRAPGEPLRRPSVRRMAEITSRAHKQPNENQGTVTAIDSPRASARDTRWRAPRLAKANSPRARLRGALATRVGREACLGSPRAPAGALWRADTPRVLRPRLARP